MKTETVATPISRSLRPAQVRRENYLVSAYTSVLVQ